MWQVWLILAGLFMISEMIIPTDFLVFWLGVGSILSMVTSFFTDNITVQIVIFSISSIALIFCTKPFVKKFMNKSESIRTNAYSIIGKTGIVLQDIDPISGKGQIKVDGDVWSAKTTMNEPISKNELVKIISIEGVKAVVEKKN